VTVILSASFLSKGARTPSQETNGLGQNFTLPLGSMKDVSDHVLSSRSRFGHRLWEPLLAFECICVHRWRWAALENCPCAINIEVDVRIERTDSNKGPHIEAG
jgi:hypothetical protein